MMSDEEALLRQLRDSSQREAAFTRLVRTYQEPLYWHIRRIVLTHENADDVLQNVFLKAWNGLSTFSGASKISTWLYRIAVNESITYMNRLHENGSIDDEGGIAGMLAADSYFDGDETQRLLQEAIASLPEKQRVVFNLRYFDEMPYNEMSTLLETSVGALKASYHHAVNKITSFFGNSD